MKIIGMILALILSGCATQNDYDQLRALTLAIAKAHNAVEARVAKVEAAMFRASPTPTPVKK